KEKKVDIEKYGQKIQEMAQARAKVAAEKEKEAAKPFLEKMAQEKGAKKLDSGVIYIEEKAGTGDLAKPTDKGKGHYTGKLIAGTVCDSAVERVQPATFPLNQVIKCWTEGVAQMKPGGKAKLICPADVAYGDRGAPPKIKPGSTLQFDVELLEIVKEQPPAGAPPRSAPKPDAKKEEAEKWWRGGPRGHAPPPRPGGRCRGGREVLMLRLATPSAASRTASGNVGCAWTVRAMSSALAPYSIASTASATKSEARAPRMWIPRMRSLAASAMILTPPSVSSRQRARALAWNGKVPMRTSTPRAFASSSVIPTLASSGAV